MSFLAPWALVVGGLAAVGTVLLHLVALQRPAAYLLPTARFIPDRRTLVRRIASRPRDLLLLALRVLLLLSVAAAFAQPVLAPRYGTRARIVLLDRSSAVASGAEGVGRVRALLGDGVATRLILFDSAATSVPDARAALDSIERAPTRPDVPGSLSAALIAARRAGATVATDADSVELVLVSPVTAAETDVALDSVRGLWPGAMTVARVAPRTDAPRSWTLEHRLSPDDPLRPALSGVRVAASPLAVRLRRAPLDHADSAFARLGGTVVHWGSDTTRASSLAPNALAMGDDVVVASLARDALSARQGGRIVARWADGTAAAIQETLGEGCVRRVAIGIPLPGDLPLRSAFQRIVRGLLAPCQVDVSGTLADAATVTRLRGQGSAAPRDALGERERRRAPLVPWLLALALACALAELLVRARSAPEAA
jgi:hypothetical protein